MHSPSLIKSSQHSSDNHSHTFSLKLTYLETEATMKSTSSNNLYLLLILRESLFHLEVLLSCLTSIHNSKQGPTHNCLIIHPVLTLDSKDQDSKARNRYQVNHIWFKRLTVQLVTLVLSVVTKNKNSTPIQLSKLSRESYSQQIEF